MTKLKNVTVIGGGSWATALVKVLCDSAGTHVKWWLRNPKDREHIRKYHTNPSYLSGVHWPATKVQVYSRIHDALKDSTYVILAVPAAFIQEPFGGVEAEALRDKTIVSAIKGMIPKANVLVTEWVREAFGVPPGQIAAIAGPCHAEEVALEKQSYLTIASDDYACAQDFSKLISTRYLTANPLVDLLGVEYAAVMKNIVAIACGISHGLGHGDNFQAVLVSNAMQEISRFVNTIDPRKRDVDASAYLGDLLVTAYSQFSRNRLLGSMLGRGYSVQAAQMEMKMVAEGYYAAQSIEMVNQSIGVYMPIAHAVYEILYDHASPMAVMENLQGKLG